MTWRKDLPKGQPNDPDDLLDEGPHQENWAAIAQSFLGKNWIANDDFQIWPAGDAAAPAYWRATGAGVAAARETVTVSRWSDMAYKITAGGGAVGVAEQRIIQAASAGKFAFLKGRPYTVCVIVRATNANAVRLGLYDGVGTTYSTDTMPITGGGTGYHSGSGSGGPDGDGYEWLYATRTIDASFTELALRVEGNAGVVFRVGVAMANLGGLVPDYWHPCERALGAVGVWLLPGSLPDTQAGIGFFRAEMDFPTLIRWTQLRVKTAPTGAAAIADANKNGTTTMYTTKPQIAASATSGGAAPDSGTYSDRCLARGDFLTMDLDQNGSGAVGVDLTATVFGMRYKRPHDARLPFTEID